MEKIYWLTRLDAINGVATTLIILAAALTSIAWIVHWATVGKRLDRVYEAEIAFSDRTRWPSLIVLIISTLFAVFVPTKKEMLMIWGIGGTIEYVQKNETLQGLPDKCVQALDAWVDTWLEDDGTK